MQVAVTNRRSVESYAVYQDECEASAKEILQMFKGPEGWVPLIFQTQGLKRADLIAHYLAMDIGLVTPQRDGMNLVAKEIIVCNPESALVLSVGAGVEQQMADNGFYKEDGEKFYHRVVDISDAVAFADVLYKAAIEDPLVVEEHGKKNREFIIANDIEKWSRAFLDPAWYLIENDIFFSFMF